PSSVISPVTTAPLVRSCSRLSARSSVVFPEPDGPIMDVTRCLPISKFTFRTAHLPLNDTDTSLRHMTGTTGSLDGMASTIETIDGSTPVAVGAFVPVLSVAESTYVRPLLDRATIMRLPMLKIKTVVINTSAMPQVWLFCWGDGDWRSLNMPVVSVDCWASRLQLPVRLTPMTHKTGAVSPTPRDKESMMPVQMRGNAKGRSTLRMTLERFAPSASAASTRIVG